VVVPLRVNVNLKACTVEDLIKRRKVGLSRLRSAAMISLMGGDLYEDDTAAHAVAGSPICDVQESPVRA
jgi:hypothetical protein